MEDYWAKDLQNVNIGRDNFDDICDQYLRDPMVALGKPSGPAMRIWRIEKNCPKNWATAYDFHVVKDKRVVLEEFAERDRGMTRAFAFNTRRDKFKDTGVRCVFNFAFDFKKMNKQFFFDQYRRGQQLLRGHRTGLFRAAAGGGALHPGTAAREGAARGLHHPVYRPCR